MRIAAAILAIIGAAALLLVGFVIPAGGDVLEPDAFGVIVSRHVEPHALYYPMCWVSLLALLAACACYADARRRD